MVCLISASPPSTATSSATLMAMFEKGSGEWFTTSRVPAFALWVISVTPPASSAVTTSKIGSGVPSTRTARNAPPTGRMTVWTVSHSESTHGTLSAKNCRKNNPPEMATMAGWPRIASSG